MVKPSQETLISLAEKIYDNLFATLIGYNGKVIEDIQTHRNITIPFKDEKFYYTVSSIERDGNILLVASYHKDKNTKYPIIDFCMTKSIFENSEDLKKVLISIFTFCIGFSIFTERFIKGEIN